MKTHTPPTAVSTRILNGKRMLVIMGLVVLAMTFVTVWWANQYLYARMLEPTRLNKEEQQILDAKMIRVLHVADDGTTSPHSYTTIIHTPLEPEPYSEKEASREIQFTEREVNALIAKDPEMAKHVAVDLADGLMSVKLVVPVNKDMPLMGGKMLNLNFGLSLSYANEKLVVAMRGISVGGIPLPRAWWGDIKDSNLVEEYGDSGGLWEQFAKGVEDLKIQDGQLHIKLKD